MMKLGRVCKKEAFEQGRAEGEERELVSFFLVMLS